MLGYHGSCELFNLITIGLKSLLWDVRCGRRVTFPPFSIVEFVLLSAFSALILKKRKINNERMKKLCLEELFLHYSSTFLIIFWMISEKNVSFRKQFQSEDSLRILDIFLVK